MPAKPQLVAFEAEFNQYKDAIGGSLDGIVGDVKKLNDLIKQLQDTQDGWTAEDQAILDNMTLTGKSLAEKAKAADELTPPGEETPPLNGVRFEMRFSAKGSELITQNRIYHDTPAATADVVSALVIAPFVAALDAKVTAGDGKGVPTDVTAIGLTDSKETAGKTWSQVPLEAVLLAEIAANEGEHAILLQDLEHVRNS